MQVMKKNDSIDYLKAFAAILVVTHHAILYSGADVTAGILEKLFTLIISVHVPLFFMIAGYLCRRQPLMPYFRKKFLRIIVPFVTFSLLKILYSHWISDEFAHAVSLPDQLIDAFVMGGLYWFPYAIVLCYGFAVPLWRARTGVLAAVLAAAVAVNILVDLPAVEVFAYFQIGNALQNFCFFLMGMLVNRCADGLATVFTKGKYAIFAGAAVVIWMGVSLPVAYNFWIKLLLAVSTAVLLWALSRTLPENIKVLKTVGKYSLQIMFFDSLHKIILFPMLGMLGMTGAVLTIAVIVLDVALCCAACTLLEKIPVIRRLFGL